MKQFQISILILSALTLTGCGSGAESEMSPPNILFIMSDDHTAQAWGIYGGILEDHVHTPHIRQLAEEGCVLENCLVSNSICTPSRATILTGQYSHVNGVKTLGAGFTPGHMHIARLMSAGGYQTSIIGKWHLQTEPTGFDYYCVLPGQGRYWNPVLKTRENWGHYLEGGIEYKGFSTDVIADMCIDWIGKRDPSKPFMAMCHFKATHEPFDYPDRFSKLYVDEVIPHPESFWDHGAESTGRSFRGQSIDNLKERYLDASENPDQKRDFQHYPDLPFSVEGMSHKEARMSTYQKFVKDFMRCGAAIDDNIGKLMAYLEEAGLAENTVVIYTADQGYFLGEHGWFDKRLIYEESIHMPFVIRYPGEITAGTRNADIIENVDFSALFADYAGLEYPASMQGRSFRDNLKGNTPSDWREYGYYRYWQHQPDRPGHFGIRGQRYKLAFFYGNGFKDENGKSEYDGGYWDFFDLQEDPHEVNNAYKDPQYQEIISDLKLEILRQRELLGDTDVGNSEILEIIARHWDD
ncbi:MAG: sulfatase [Bacteroidetes bacterium]|nr:sulfatase [Bacteroidota bacterium]